MFFIWKARRFDRFDAFFEFGFVGNVYRLLQVRDFAEYSRILQALFLAAQYYALDPAS